MNNEHVKRGMQIMAAQYVQAVLECKYGCRVKLKGDEPGLFLLEAWTPKGTYEKNKVQILCEDEGAKTIGVLIARHIASRRIPIIGLDYHLIKLPDVPGLYSLEEETLQQLMDEKKHINTFVGDDGSEYVVYERKLLLDHCTYIKA